MVHGVDFRSLSYWQIFSSLRKWWEGDQQFPKSPAHPTYLTILSLDTSGWIMLEDGVAPAFFISLSSASYYHQREKISRLNAMHFFVSFILLVFYCCFYESLCCTSKDQFMPSIFFLFFTMSWVVKNKREENNPFIFCSFLNCHVWRALKYICAI